MTLIRIIMENKIKSSMIMLSSPVHIIVFIMKIATIITITAIMVITSITYIIVRRAIGTNIK